MYYLYTKLYRYSENLATAGTREPVWRMGFLRMVECRSGKEACDINWKIVVCSSVDCVHIGWDQHPTY